MSKVLKATSWTTGGYVFAQFLRLASNLILVRLLVPEDFGIMALVMSITIGVAMLTDLGSQASIVQNEKGEDVKFLQTVFVFQILKGFFVWFICLVLAAGLYIVSHYNFFADDSVYSHPLLPYVIGVATFMTVIDGFKSVNFALAKRHISFARLTMIDIAAQIIGTFITIFIAFHYPTVWALVTGLLIVYLLKTLASHFFLEGKFVGFGWSTPYFLELFHFGKWLLGSSFLTFLSKHADRFILGALLPANYFGVYAIAILFYGSGKMLIDKYQYDVVFPVLSKLNREEQGQLSHKLYGLRKYANIFLFSGAGMMAVLGDDFIQLLYDPRYYDAGWMLQILSIGIVAATMQINISIFLAIGQTSYMMLIQAVNSLSLIAMIFLMNHFFGDIGLLIGVGGSGFVAVLLIMVLLHQKGYLNILKEVIYLPAIALGALIGFGVEYILMQILPNF